VISAPFLALAMKVGKVKELAVRILVRLAPTLAVPADIPSEHISRDPEQVARYAADTRRTMKLTTSWVAAMEDAHARVEAEVNEVTLPMHWYVPMGDLICDPHQALKVFATLPDPEGKDQTLRRWPGYYHELHNEPAELRAPVIESVHEWLLAHLDEGERESTS
jgi:alpha-beta hydrolase superfamily lysophospholipase